MSSIVNDSPTLPLNSSPAKGRYLLGPIPDFFLLGGGTLALVPIFLLLPTSWIDRAQVLAWTTLIAHGINNPHFAHSYHLFYRGFLHKSFSAEYSSSWRARYLIAGVLAPLLLLGFFSYCLVAGQTSLLGYGVNLMFFTVGWHYTKQGYGMAMLDAVLKRRFFTEHEKKLLLHHAYAVWALSWLISNTYAWKSEYWGIPYQSFGIPAPIRYAAWAAVFITGARMLHGFALLLRAGRRLPINGLVAYGVSGYIWLLYPDPILALVFPALHSLQYMVVVWRYELNVQTERVHLDEGGRADEAPSAAPFSLGLRMALFYGIAVGLGYFGFWYFPETLGRWLPGTLQTFGGGVFLFCTWIFINVHHYFMDNVIWRKGNPETGKYLFR